MSTREAGGPLHVTDDELLDLANEFLPPEERATVVAHLLECPDCDSRFHRLVSDHERGLALASTALGSAVPTLDRTSSISPIAGPGARRAGPGRVRMMLAAACLVLVVGASLLMRGSGERSTPVSRAENAWLPPVTASGALRGAGGARAESLVTAGIDAYEHRDLRRAEALLRVEGAGEAMEWVRRLYLANTLVALGRPRESVPLLASPSYILPEPWRGEWDWTLMVALAGTGEPARADSLLHVLRERDDEIGARARALTDSPRSRR